METNDFEKKLQNGYKEMLNSVSDFIEKEGKTVKEAVDAAEDKLSEWHELSREEVYKISNAVRNDVGHFGETWEEAKDYFQQKLSLDADYLTDSVWDKLSGIANNATLDFIEFQKDLQQRAGKISEASDQKQMDSHGEHEAWLTEIYLWEQEYQDAQEKLTLIDKALRSHREQLQQHAQAIRLHIETDKQGKATDKKQAEMQKLHQQQAVNHAKLKKEQRQTILLIEKLYKLLS